MRTVAALLTLVACSLPAVSFADAGTDPESTEVEVEEDELLQELPTEDDAALPEEDETELESETEEEPEPPPTPSGPSQPEVDRMLERVRSQHPLKFCEDPAYRVPLDEEQFCGFAKDNAARCPKFEEACRRTREAAATTPPEKGETRRRDSDARADVGPLGSLGFILFWALIVAAVIAFGALIAKSFRRGSRDPSPDSAPDEIESQEAPASRRPVETDVDRLLARARARAQQRDYMGAIADAHAAVLRHLELDGKLELHPSRTNGDYLRALRSEGELFTKVREVTREVDRAQFGKSPPAAEAFDRALRLVLPLVGRAVMLAFALGFFATATACSEPSPHDDEAGISFGASPAGHAVLAELLKERGASVRHRLSEVDEISSDVSRVLVLDANLEEDEWYVLLAFAEQGGTLLVAGLDPVAEERLGISQSPRACSEQLRVSDTSYEAAVLGLEDAEVVGAPSSTLRFDRDEAESVLDCDDAPYLSTSTYGEGKLIVLADTSFLANASLLARENARVALGLLETQRTVEIIDVWTSRSAKTPFAAISNAHLTPFFVQALVLLALLAAWRGVHFGTPRDPPERKRRVFSEHVRALGLTYARARASKMALAHYAAWALDRLRERTLPGGGKLSELARAIGKRLDRPEGEVMRTLVDGRSAWDESDLGPRSQGSRAPPSEAAGRSAPRGSDAASGERFDLEVLRALSALVEGTGGNKR